MKTKEILKWELIKRAQLLVESREENPNGNIAPIDGYFKTTCSSAYERRILQEIKKEQMKDSERDRKAGLEIEAYELAIVETIDARLEFMKAFV